MPELLSTSVLTCNLSPRLRHTSLCSWTVPCMFGEVCIATLLSEPTSSAANAAVSRLLLAPDSSSSLNLLLDLPHSSDSASAPVKLWPAALLAVLPAVLAAVLTAVLANVHPLLTYGVKAGVLCMPTNPAQVVTAVASVHDVC